MANILAAETGIIEFRRQAESAQRRRRFLQLALGIAFPLALLLLWQVLVWLGIIDGRFFPPPSQIVTSSATLLSDAGARAMLLRDMGASSLRILVGYSLGAAAGITTGVLMGRVALLRFALGPTIQAIYPMPKLAVFPLFIVIFGLGDASKIALIALGVFFMTCMSTLSGVLASNPIHHDVAKSFRFPLWTRWTRVLLPGALPAIVTGLKLGLGQALIVVVSTEMISGDDGMGHFIWESWQILDIPRMFLGLVIVALAGGAAMLFGDLLERRLTPWVAH
jgi:ABC-type nitrate/sulfonate/bicarbonate transport system permease component